MRFGRIEIDFAEVYFRNSALSQTCCNALSQKCIFAIVHFRKSVYFRKNAFSQKCIFAKVYFRKNALSQKCIFAKVHFRKGVFSQYSVFAKVYLCRSNQYFTNYKCCSLQEQSIFLQKILRMKIDALCRSNQYFTNEN